MQSTVECSSLAIIVSDALACPREKSSSTRCLNLEPLPQEHRPRPTKWKGSENDSVTLQPPKNVHILGAENVHELSTILCTGKLETLKFTDQQT